MTARWNFSYSPSNRKTINGTTFYKVAIGSETKWLSMSGIKMLLIHFVRDELVVDFALIE